MSPAASPHPPSLHPLSELPLDAGAQVHGVRTRPGPGGDDRSQQLADIGFVPGERVSVVARAWPGGDPLVVRVGQSRFALRRAEADCIWVQALPQP